jgi:hypothetical protein
MNAVLLFLETKSERASIQQRINTRRGLRTVDNQFKTTAGPIFPILTCLYLASTTIGGIDMCMESFNTKADDVVDSPVTHIDQLNMGAAEDIANQLLHKLVNKVPCLIDRISKCIQRISEMPLSSRPLKDADLEVIFGVGCTVETVITTPTVDRSINLGNGCMNQLNSFAKSEDDLCDDPDMIEADCSTLDEDSSDDDMSEGGQSARSDNYHTQTISQDTQDNILRQFSASEQLPQQSHNTLLLEERLGYTVLQAELPPYAQLRDRPIDWFDECEVHFELPFLFKLLTSLSNSPK